MKISNAKSIGLVCLLLVPSIVLAGDLSAIINGKSYHVNSTYDWNENNYGIGLEYEFATESRWKKTILANGFLDSNDAMSYMAGAGLHRRLIDTDRLAGFHFDAGLTAFVMTREDVNGNKPFPGILPSLTIGNRYAGFNLTYLPKVAIQEMLEARVDDPTISGIIFVQFKVPLGRIITQQ